MTTDTITDLEQFLKLQTRLHGAESAQAAVVMFGLGRACAEHRSYRQAQEWLHQALTIQERLGVDGQVIADTRRELNAVLAKIPSAPSAPCAPSASSAHKAKPDDTVDRMTLSSDSLPVFEMPLKKVPDELDEAIEQCEVEIASLRQGGARKTALADGLVKLAKLYGRKKMLPEMEPILVEALKIRETELGREHLSVSVDLKNLAKLYYFQGRYDEAEQLFRRAMNMRASLLGPLHPHVADIAVWYAKSLRSCDRISEAAAMEALVRECQAKDGTDWENYKTAGVKAMEDENYFMAQAMWLGALDESKKFSVDDPRLCATLENLAEVYWKQAKYDRAESLCQRILQLSERILGAAHPDVAQAANNMALVCERQGKYGEASILYRQALTINENLHGMEHPSVIALRECHERARRLIQKQVELKVEKVEESWTN